MINKPKYKIGRRLGAGVYDKCQTQKFALSEARHAKSRKKRRPRAKTDFAVQFIEKQKVRFSYGITEKQFSNYVKDAITSKGVNAADKLFENLESRLDNTIYRLGLAVSRTQARQMVSHGHFLINNRRVTIPSFRIKKDDVVTIREGSKKSVLFSNMGKKLKDYNFPNWLQFDVNKIEAKVKGKPQNTETFLDFNAVLEFYSR